MSATSSDNEGEREDPKPTEREASVDREDESGGDHSDHESSNEDEAAKRNGDVVTTEPKANSDLREWSSGLCHCHKDVGNCFLVACCPICAAGYELYKHDENPLLGICFNSTLMAFIAQYRARNKIEGSLCMDCMTTLFCGPCSLCRLHRDYEEMVK